MSKISRTSKITSRMSRISRIISPIDLPIQELPPVITTNTHKKMKGEWVPLIELEPKRKKRPHDRNQQLVPYPIPPPPEPVPKRPLLLCWTPKHLKFDLYEEPIILRLKVNNNNKHSIYMQCYSLWDGGARLGANWSAYPQKRYWIPPGFNVYLYVSAVPLPDPPNPSSYSVLQLVASHLRDNVVGHFAIPIHTCFYQYVTPLTGEE